MPQLMRCLYCGLLQDEPIGVKQCVRCGGELAYEQPYQTGLYNGSYLHVQMELDQVSAPAGRPVDRYLLITIHTPSEVPSEYAAVTETGRPPIHFAAVLDISGSMAGEKLYHLKTAVHQAVHLLRRDDVISLTTFSNNPYLLLRPSSVSAAVQNQIELVLREIKAGGMTALDGGLQLGIEQAQEKQLDSCLVLLLSDGHANVGEVDLERVGLRALKAHEQGLVISTLGLGMDYNEALMTEIAVQGGGRYYHVKSPEQISAYLTGELGEAADLAARDVQIHIHLPEGAVLVPFSAAYRISMGAGEAVVSIGDIPRDLQVEIPLRLTLFGGAAGERLSLDGEVTYRSPAGHVLASPLNRVTVRFMTGEAFLPQHGLVRPVAERVAGQMRAAQVLQFSRAQARREPGEMRRFSEERQKLQEYVTLLGDEIAVRWMSEMDEDLNHLRAASPAAKTIQSKAFKDSRFMRDLDKD